MPVPTITPTPKTVRSTGPSRLRSWWVGSSVSAMDCSMVFVRQMFITYLPGKRRRRPEVGARRPGSSPIKQNLAKALQKKGKRPLGWAWASLQAAFDAQGPTAVVLPRQCDCQATS
jgi:hypothetical protein